MNRMTRGIAFVGMMLLAAPAAFNWSILREASALNEGWQDAVAGNWTKVFCSDETLREALGSGWTVTTKWVTSDGQEFSAETTCP